MEKEMGQQVPYIGLSLSLCSYMYIMSSSQEKDDISLQ